MTYKKLTSSAVPPHRATPGAIPGRSMWLWDSLNVQHCGCIAFCNQGLRQQTAVPRSNRSHFCTTIQNNQLQLFLHYNTKQPTATISELQYKTTNCSHFCTTIQKNQLQPFLHYNTKQPNAAISALQYKTTNCSHFCTTIQNNQLQPFLNYNTKQPNAAISALQYKTTKCSHFCTTIHSNQLQPFLHKLKKALSLPA
jgi:hypothetical protein